MGADARQQARHIQPKRRGRPREKQPPPGLARRNLLVDPETLERVRAIYAAKSESEAVRQALDAVLLAHEAEELSDWIAARGGPLDVYERTTGGSRLPGHLEPGAVPDDEKEWF